MEKRVGYISLGWIDGEAHGEYVYGHVSDEEFWETVTLGQGEGFDRETLGAPEHIYIRWVPDPSGEFEVLLRECEGPASDDVFAVTRARYE